MLFSLYFFYASFYFEAFSRGWQKKDSFTGTWLNKYVWQGWLSAKPISFFLSNRNYDFEHLTAQNGLNFLQFTKYNNRFLNSYTFAKLHSTAPNTFNTVEM